MSDELFDSPENRQHMARLMRNQHISVTFAPDDLEMTADLIDPTTTAHEEQPYELCCDTCGKAFVEYMYGHMYLRQARYCPACGRRITAVREFGGGTEYVPVENEEGDE